MAIITKPEQLDDVLKEMCRRVGVDHASVDFKKHGWYLDYSWPSFEEESAWIDWLTDYLMTKCRVRGKKMATRAAHEFNLYYGWKTAVEETNKP